MFVTNCLKNEFKFDELIKEIEFEHITSGRNAAILIDINNNLIPIIRSTTKYNKPAQKFLPIHYILIQNICNLLNCKFNNAMFEIYDTSYRKMKFHTDQALDLESHSIICIFSCYSDFVEKKYLRKLFIKNKSTSEQSELLLENNSIISFSTDINKNYVHKIILLCSEKNNIKWLGITLRLSKTYTKFINEIPYFSHNDKQLKLATDNEKKQLIIYKYKENNSINFVYPEIDYTLSLSDLMPIKN